MKIPDDVFQTRCRYCIHGRPGKENKEIPDDKLFLNFWTEQAPCRILGISQCDKVQGECLSFHPRKMFGICQFCAFTTSFADGYCRFPKGPMNKRRVFLGHCGSEYYTEHALFTCDRYQAHPWCKESIMKNTLAGLAPANFDPDTWEAIERIEGTAAEKQWETLKAKRQATLKEAESKAKTNAAEAPEQVSLFDTMEGDGKG